MPHKKKNKYDLLMKTKFRLPMNIHRIFGTAHTSRFNATTTCLSNLFEIDVPLGPCISRWDMKSKKKIGFFQAHSDVITFMKRSPKKGLIATTSNGGEVKLWDNDWKNLSEINVGEERLTNAEWSMNEKQIIVVCEEKGTIFVINNEVIDGEYKLKILKSLSDSFELACITKSGEIIAVQQSTSKKKEGAKILLFDKDLNPLKSTKIFDNDVIGFFSIDSSHSNVLFSSSLCPREILLLNCETFQIENKFTVKGKGAIRSMIIEEDRFIFPSDNGTIYFYTLKGDLIKEEKVPSGIYYFMEWAKKDEILWLATEGNLIQHKIGSKFNDEANSEISFHNLTCCGLDFSSDGKFLACGDFLGNVYLWDIENHKESLNINLMASIRSLSWRKNSNDIYIGCMDGSIYHWNIEKNEYNLLLEMKGSITCLEWNRVENPTKLAIGTTKGFLSIYCEKDKKIIHQFLAHPPVENHERRDAFGSIDLFSEIWSLKWSPDNQNIITSSEDQTSRVWDLKGNEIIQLKGHTTAVTGVDWRHTEIGEIIVTCADDKKLMVWLVDGFKLLTEFNSDVVEWHTLTYLALEEKGSRAITVTQNGYVLIYSIKDEKLIFKKKLHNGSIEGLKWNFEKNLIGSCSSDCTVNIYKID